MNKKGIAVQTIILVLLGLVVLVFIAYWLYTLFAGETPLSMEQCRTELLTWCDMCKNNQWGTTSDPMLASDPVAQRCWLDYYDQFGLRVPAAADKCSTLQSQCSILGIR